MFAVSHKSESGKRKGRFFKTRTEAETPALSIETECVRRETGKVPRSISALAPKQNTGKYRVLLELLPERAKKTGGRAGQIGDRETPISVPVRRVGDDGLPVDGRRQVGGGLQDVKIA